MGQDITVAIFNTKELIEKLQQWGANDIDLLMAILKECGTFLAEGSQYALAFNDHAYLSNPGFILSKLLEWAFHKDDVYVPFYECSSIDIMTAIKEEEEVWDIAERLGIKLKDDDGEEEE